MKLVFKPLLFLIVAAGVCYLLLPAPVFPAPPPDTLRSNEPGDMETVFRRAYYTNYSREWILDYYSHQFFLPGQMLLNFPPEDAFTLIRDQTKSSWLQQLVHPFRESLYINGFYPVKPTEQIYIDNVHYLNKITVRYVPSSAATRLTVMLLSGVCIYLLYREYAQV